MGYARRRWHRAAMVVALWCGTGACAPSATPAAATAERPVRMTAPADAPDPAVAYANGQSGGGPTYHEGYVSLDGERLHFVEAGRGPLVILYHGFPTYWLSWLDQMEMLKHCYRVVAIDAQGAGRSSKPLDASAYRIDRLAAQLDGFAAHIAPGERFRLVGHDWGGALAWSYAQRYPHRLHDLVVMSAPPYNLFVRLAVNDPEQRARSQYMQRFRQIGRDDLSDGRIVTTLFNSAYDGLISGGALTANEAALFRDAVAHADAVHGGMNWYRGNLGDFAAMQPADAWPGGGASTTVPTLLLWGEADRTFVPRFLDLASEYASNLTIVRIPDVGHWLSMELPERTNAALRDRLMPGGRCPSA